MWVKNFFPCVILFFPDGTSNAAQAAQHKKAAMDKIRDVWTARSAVGYLDAQCTTPADILTAISGLEWEDEYLIPEKNTHII